MADISWLSKLSSFINIIVAISVTFSLYYLILFYYAMSKPLAPYNPLLKFLVVKITLFFTFWQALTLSMIEEPLLHNCFDNESEYFNETKIMTGIENTLICVEMFFMALAGGCAFSYEDFKNGTPKRAKFKSVFEDIIRTFKQDFKLIRPKKFGF